MDDVGPAAMHVRTDDARAESEPFSERQGPGPLGDEPVGARLDEELPGMLDLTGQPGRRVEMLGPDVPAEPRTGLEERQVDRQRALPTYLDQPVGRGKAGDAPAHYRRPQGRPHAAILGRPHAAI